MINLLSYREELDEDKLKKYAGVKFNLVQCSGENICTKIGTHASHFWYEEAMILDLIIFTKTTKNDKGKIFETQESQWVPIRWHNFSWSFIEVKKAFKDFADLGLINKALDYAKLNCFDPAGDPNNMAGQLGFTSFASFIESLESK